MACSRTKMIGKNGGSIAVDLGDSQPLCLHPHIPESVQSQSRVGTPCVGRLWGFPEASVATPRTPTTHHHLPGCPRCLRLPRGLPVSLGPSLPRNFPYLHPDSDRPVTAANRTSKPSVPPAPRHPASTANFIAHPAVTSTQSGRTLPVAVVSPGGCTAPSTAVAIGSSTPPASTDLPPPPSTQQARIQACRPSSLKTSQVSTTYIISMEKPSMQ